MATLLHAHENTDAMHAKAPAMRSARCLSYRGQFCFRKPVRRATVAVRAVVDDEEIDDKVAQFLEQQDLTERGVEKKAEITEVLGQDEVDDEQAKAYCRDVVRVLRMLKEKRDMELREAKLIVAIDDPRNDDARKMGIEDSSGVSRDEMAAALEQVAAGQLPNDRIALRVLHAEMINWPFLDSDEKSAKYTNFEARGAPSLLRLPCVPPSRATHPIPS